jgi:hypothetical protein
MKRYVRKTSGRYCDRCPRLCGQKSLTSRPETEMHAAAYLNGFQILASCTSVLAWAVESRRQSRKPGSYPLVAGKDSCWPSGVCDYKNRSKRRQFDETLVGKNGSSRILKFMQTQVTLGWNFAEIATGIAVVSREAPATFCISSRGRINDATPRVWSRARLRTAES